MLWNNTLYLVLFELILINANLRVVARFYCKIIILTTKCQMFVDNVQQEKADLVNHACCMDLCRRQNILITMYHVYVTHTHRHTHTHTHTLIYNLWWGNTVTRHGCFGAWTLRTTDRLEFRSMSRDISNHVKGHFGPWLSKFRSMIEDKSDHGIGYFGPYIGITLKSIVKDK